MNGVAERVEKTKRRPGSLKTEVQHRLQLQGVGREVEPGLVAFGQRVVGEEVVDAEVAGVVGHVVDPRVGEVGEDVGVVEPGHGDLRDHHLEEGREGAEDSLSPRFRAESGGHGEVVALHDAGVDIDLGVILADMVQAAGTFEIRIDDDDLPGDIVDPRQDLADNLAEVVTVLGGLRGAAQVDGLGLRCGVILQKRHRLGHSRGPGGSRRRG